MNKETIFSTLGEKIIYQIYPKSFYDSNADGIGDIRGIIEKIDYIVSLHIDMIWFNPFSYLLKMIMDMTLLIITTLIHYLGQLKISKN